MGQTTKNNVRISGIQMALQRELAGYTQREWGDLLGLSEKRVQQIERKPEVGVYRRTIRKVAEVLKVPVDQALKLLTPPDPNTPSKYDWSIVGEPGEGGAVIGHEDPPDFVAFVISLDNALSGLSHFKANPMALWPRLRRLVEIIAEREKTTPDAVVERQLVELGEEQSLAVADRILQRHDRAEDRGKGTPGMRRAATTKSGPEDPAPRADRRKKK